MGQLSVFGILYPRFMFPKQKKIRLVELFSGIGFQSMGMKLAEIDHEQIATSEIDKYAIKSYEAIHGISNNLGDISKLTGADFPKEIDIMTYSFPCQDLSKAGKQKGMGEGSRSGLVYEVIRILQDLKELDNLPKVLIMENVVDLVQTKFIKSFNEIQKEIEDMGYSNYTQILNAKNYGIAQNRERVFMVSILGEYNYDFPKEFELEYRLKDYLEDEVDEKYYLSDKLLKYMTDMTDRNGFIRGARFNPLDNDSKTAFTVTTNAGNRPTDNFIKTPVRIGGVFDKDGKTHQAGAIWDKEAISPTLDTMQGGHREPKILMPEATKQGYAEAHDGDGVYINRPHQKRGVVQKGMIQTLKTSGNDVGVVVNRFYKQAIDTLNGNECNYGDTISAYNTTVDKSGTSPTITTRPEGFKTAILPITHDLRIRKLTPRETGRLMGMNDNQIDKQLEVVSNAQAYKQHGNGIVAQVIGLIIGMMIYEDENELRQKVMKNSHTWL